MDFKKYKIKDIGEVVGGATPLTKDSDNYDGDISWITPNDLSNYKDVYINRGERNITAKGLKEIGNKLLPKGTVLFSSRAPIGYVAIANQELCTNQGFKSVIPNYELVTSEYLYYTLGFYKSFIEKQGSGTTFMEVSGATMENIELPIPALEEQRRITDTLIKIDKKIALNKRMNAELEAMAKQLYDYWFVQFDFPDENGNPYKSSGGKMVYNPTLKREIPAGWEVSNYGNEFDVKLGGTPSTSEDSFWKDGTINWLNSGEVQNFPINSSEKKITESALNGSSTEFLPKGSVLISITRYLRVTILNIDACINQSVAGFAETDILKYPYTYFALSAEVPRLMKLRSGAQQPHINKEIIEASPILLPPKRILREYYTSCSPIIDTLFKKSEEIEELIHLRDSLLPMLMNGQVTVE